MNSHKSTPETWTQESRNSVIPVRKQRWLFLVSAVLTCVLLVAGAKPSLAGRIYVANYNDGTVRAFDLQTGAILPFTDLQLDHPRGISADNSGNIYVVSSHTVNKFGPDGTDLGILPTNNLGGFWGVAFDTAGNLYSSDWKIGAGFEIHKFGPDGADLGTFASTGSAASGIAIDGNGNLYAGVLGSSYVGLCPIRKFGPDGSDLGIFAYSYAPMDLAFDRDGNLYACANSSPTGANVNCPIEKFAPDGTPLGTFALTASSQSLAFDRAGNLYVAHSFLNQIQKFSSQGIDLGAFGSSGLDGPDAIEIVEEPVRPQLQIELEQANIVLSWSATNQDARLQFSLNLANGWADASAAPILANGQFRVVWTNQAPQAFFRLR
jgi:DNA-binding beta-propeller fold protein YncE